MLALLLPLCLLVVPAGQTWTVDDDGPADFAQILDAIPQVGSGDVLLVEPGEYEGFHLAKRLTILGRAGVSRPHVSGLVHVGAQSFTLAGLDFDGLRIEEVAGRGRIDDCRVGVVGDSKQPYAVTVFACAQIVLSRTIVWGSKAYSQSVGYQTPGGGAMDVATSNVTLVDCELRGAKGFTSTEGGFSFGGPGGTGLLVTAGSQIVLAGSSVEGGWEGWSSCGFCYCEDGPGGPGVQIKDSTLVLRGKTGDVVLGGFADDYCPPVLPGLAIDATNSTVVASGAGIGSGLSWVNSQYLTPSPAEPFMSIGGTDQPGGERHIDLFGPPGVSTLLVVSVAPAHAPLGSFEGALWLDPSALWLIIPLVFSGQQIPLSLHWTVPRSTAGLEGLVVELQAFCPAIPGAIDPGKSLAGNVAELIVRF